MSNDFGQYLSQLRKARIISLRQLGEAVGMSATYISDVENGRRIPMKADKLRIICNVLKLDEIEKYTLLDLASKDRNELAADIVEYLNYNPSAKDTIRRASANHLTDDAWQRFIEELGEEVNTNASN